MQQNKVGERKYCRLFGRFSVGVLLLCNIVFAESFSEFKAQQSRAYTQYKNEQDREFASYLKEQWKAYKKFAGIPMYEKPKLKRIPKAPQKPLAKKGPKVYIKVQPLPKKQELIQKPKKTVSKKPIVTQIPDSNIVKNPIPSQPKVAPVEVVSQPQKDITFSFFGAMVGFDIPQKIKKAKFYPNNQQGIANYFNTVASSEYDVLLDDIQSVQKQLHLNDWGLYLLTKKIAQKIYHYPDEVALFQWFVFNKLGYRVKVGLANGKVIAMFYSKKTIYATPNFRFNGKKYYVLSHYNKHGLGMVYSYRQDYPHATKPFDLSLKVIPNFPHKYVTKTKQFYFNHKRYSISYKYDKNLIDFFATYPQADFGSFFNAAVDDVTYASLADSLRKYINGMRASEAMNFVLAFVQKGFNYKTDQQQFGREKVMFVEETLHYPACDCEDRSILYAFLIKKLFQVPVLGIEYPNHMATALYVPLDGDKVRIRGREFVVADPTYINAQIGMAMPKFRGKMPKDFIYVSLK